MPAISTSSKILLTGATGFLGSWILKELLERGFQVRVAVRSERKATHLRTLAKDRSDSLEFVIVEDITTPGAFDEAVKGVDGIIHAASPLANVGTGDPKDTIDPAVQGTVGILKSAQGSASVKRVVVTSSIAAQMNLSKQPPISLDETDWNDPVVKALEQQGKASPPFVVYSASKTLAERAAWDLVKEGNPQFDLVTILPGFLLGQNITEAANYDAGSNTRLTIPLKKTTQANIKRETLLDELNIVDVRDTAKMHVDALILPAAGGERITASAARITVQHMYDILNASPVDGLEVIRGEPDLLKDWAPNVSFSTNKSQEILGVKYRSAEEVVRNTIVHALADGWKQ